MNIRRISQWKLPLATNSKVDNVRERFTFFKLEYLLQRVVNMWF